MTPKEIAEAIAEKIYATSAVARVSCQETLADEISEVLESLNLTAAPKVEGSVKVQIAIGYGPSSERGKYVIQASGVDSYESIISAKEDAFFHDDTHRAVVEAWIPPVAPVPVVEGTVTR